MDSDDNDSDSEQDYKSDSDINNLVEMEEHLDDDIEEIEHNINNNDSLIEKLQQRLDLLYSKLTEENLVFSEFQEEISTVQQEIAMLRVDSIKEYLNFEDLSKLRSELTNIFEQSSKLKQPEHVLALSNFEQKKIRLGAFETKLRGQVEDLVDQYKIANREKRIEESEEAPKVKKPSRIVTPEEVRFFITRMPESLEESELVVDFFKNNMNYLNRRYTIQIFGSYDNARKIYNSLEKNVDLKLLQVLQLYIAGVIVVIESDFHSFTSLLKDSSESEIKAYKSKIIVNSKLKKKDLSEDFKILQGEVSDEQLQDFIQDNQEIEDINDPDKALHIMYQRILSKYSKFLPETNNQKRGFVDDINDFNTGKNYHSPVRNAGNLSNDISPEDYIDYLGTTINLKEVANKPDLESLRIILSKFPKESLLGCIDNVKYETSRHPYISKLFNNKTKILKFRENPTTVKDLANSLNKTIDELKLSKKFRNKSSNTKIVLIDSKSAEGSKFLTKLPNNLVPYEDGDVNPLVVKDFFNNLSKYNSELVMPADNLLYKELKKNQFSNILKALKSTKEYGNFTLNSKGIDSLIPFVSPTQFITELDGLMSVNPKKTYSTNQVESGGPSVIGNTSKKSLLVNKLEYLSLRAKGVIGLTLRRVPLKSKIPNSFKVFIQGDEYNLVIERPPAVSGFGWSIPLDNDTRIILTDFDEYLKSLKNIFTEKINVMRESNSKNNTNGSILIKKIKIINQYLKIEDLDLDRLVPKIINSEIKETQFRILEKQKLLNNVLKLQIDGNLPPESIIQAVSELERVAASCVNNIKTQKQTYLYYMGEILVILKLYPNVLELMVNGKLLPTDVINISSGFNSSIIQKLNKIDLDFETLVNWKPVHSNLSNQPGLMELVLEECKKDIPIETIISFNNVSDLNLPILVKKAIVLESFMYIKWEVVLKKAKESIRKNKDNKIRITRYLNNQHLKIINIGSPVINIKTRIESINKISKKVEYCKKEGVENVEDVDNDILASRIEMVVFNLSGSLDEYRSTISNIYNESESDIGTKLNFCTLLTPNNTKLVGEIAKRYVFLPQIYKGKTDQEILANASIPVLKALESLQNNMLDIIDNNKNIRREFKMIGKKIALRNIILKQFIKKKQERNAQEAVAIFNGKITADQVDIINDQENKKLAKRGLNLISTHNLQKWREQMYTPPTLVSKIPNILSITVIPLPEKRGFWVYGNFPNNVIPYRYKEGDVLKSHFEVLSSHILSNPIRFEYKTNLINQPATDEETSFLQELNKRLSLRFTLKDEFTISKLKNICLYSGYSPEEFILFPDELDLVPWITNNNGDIEIIPFDEYLVKLINSGNLYRTSENTDSEIREFNKKHGLNLSIVQFKGLNFDILEKNFSDYNNYLLNKNLDFSKMHKRCITDNIEQITKTQESTYYKGKKELLPMTLTQYKNYVKNKGIKGVIPSDSQIAKDFFEIKKQGLQVHYSNLPYYIINNQIYRVKEDKSSNYPVPIGRSGQYPIYSRNQLNDLGSLLLSGRLSPWLNNNVRVVYGKTSNDIKVGDRVNINGDDGNVYVDTIGLVKNIDVNNKVTYMVEYSKSGKLYLGTFKNNSITPLLVKDVTGFEGDPPWFIKDYNVKSAISYLKSEEFKSLDRLEKNKTLQLIIRDFSIPHQNISQLTSELEKQKSLILEILKLENKQIKTFSKSLKDHYKKRGYDIPLWGSTEGVGSGSNLDKNQILEFYNILGLNNPTILNSKIYDRFRSVFDALNYLNTQNFKIKKESERNADLQDISLKLNLNTTGLNLNIENLNLNYKNVITKLETIIKPVSEALDHLNDTMWWNDSSFEKSVSMYNNIAKAMGIKEETINKENFLRKLQLRAKHIYQTDKYINSNLYDTLTSQEESDLLNKIIYDFNLQIGVKSKDIIKKLSLNTGGLVSSFYIEQKFNDKYGKEIIVKEGVNKSKILWRPSNWDPCNHFTKSEINYKILEAISFLNSEKFSELEESTKNKTLVEIANYWNISNSPKKIIKELEKLITKGGGTNRCSNIGGSICLWNGNSCNTYTNSVVPIESPEQRIQRLLKNRNIEYLPKISVVPEYKKYKEDVWVWQPFAKPSRNSTEFKNWITNPEVRLWNNKVKMSLSELQNLLYGRLRSNSMSFIKRKNELTIELEEFRKRMKSQKYVQEPVKNTKLSKRKGGSEWRPDDDFVIKSLAESYIEKLLQNNIIRFTDNAIQFLRDIDNDKSYIGRIYNRFDIVEREVTNDVNNKKSNKTISRQYISVPNKQINVLDIIKNMSYTRKLELENIDPNTKLFGFGILFDYLVNKSRVNQGSFSIKTPDKPVTIEVRDILDYLGDSYMQYGKYVYGINYKEDNNNIVYEFLKPPCGYTEILDTDNSYLTFNNSSEFQNIYMIDSDIHRKNAISTDIARRFSMVLGIDIRYIPPCFKSKLSEKSERKKLNAITAEDVKTYFVRAGKGYYLSELSEDDLKSSKNINYLNKKKLDDKNDKSKYEKAVKAIFSKSSKIEGKDLVTRVKNASRIYKINSEILLSLAEDIKIAKESKGSSKGSIDTIFKNLEITVNGLDSAYRKKWKMADISKSFRKEFGFELNDYLKDPRFTKADRIIRIGDWQ